MKVWRQKVGKGECYEVRREDRPLLFSLFKVFDSEDAAKMVTLIRGTTV